MGRKYKKPHVVRHKPKPPPEPVSPPASGPVTRGGPHSLSGEALAEVSATSTELPSKLQDVDLNPSVEPMESPKSADDNDNDDLSDDSDPDDRTVASWDVFMTPEIQEKLLLLQYPERSRTQPYNDANHQKPLELRIKPKTGMVEVDVPVNIHANYDREKGVQWGEAVRKSRVLKGGGSYGLAGGLGIGANPKKDDEEDEDEAISQEVLLANFEDANNKGHVLNKQTLGGQIVEPKDGDPIYMLGTFVGSKCSTYFSLCTILLHD